MKRKRGSYWWLEYIGWYGVLAILGAYALLSFDIVAAKSLMYQLLNVTGAIGIGLEAYVKRDMQPVVLNMVWAAIALIALIQLAIS